MTETHEVRVLFVDDISDFLDQVVPLFNAYGFDARGSTEVDKAKALLRAEPFHVAVVDMVWAHDRRRGLKLIRWIKETDLPYPTQSILLTGQATVEEQAEAAAAGALACKPKPADPEGYTVLRGEVANAGRVADGLALSKRVARLLRGVANQLKAARGLCQTSVLPSGDPKDLARSTVLLEEAESVLRDLADALDQAGQAGPDALLPPVAPTE